MAVTRQIFKNLAQKFVDNTFADFTNEFTIEQLTETSDGQGGYTVAWTTFATVTGFVQKQSGDERTKDDRLDSQYPTKFMFEYIAGITNDMRISFNSQTYNIRSIMPVYEVDVWIEIIADEGDAT